MKKLAKINGRPHRSISPSELSPVKIKFNPSNTEDTIEYEFPSFMEYFIGDIKKCEFDDLQLGIFSYFNNAGLITFSPEMYPTLWGTIVASQTSIESVLINGETGTGKELIANEICKLSCKDKEETKKCKECKRFVAINCAALPETLIESELFGYKKGAFSEARTDKQGLLADAEVLFLDEVGNASISLQQKLLRILEEKTFRPVGSKTKPVPLQLKKLICATNRNPEECISKGTMLSDFFDRISGYEIFIPPLNERGNTDKILLSNYFLLKTIKEGIIAKNIKGNQNTLMLDDEYFFRMIIHVTEIYPAENVRTLKHRIRLYVAQAQAYSYVTEKYFPYVVEQKRTLAENMFYTMRFVFPDKEPEPEKPIQENKPDFSGWGAAQKNTNEQLSAFAQALAAASRNNNADPIPPFIPIPETTRRKTLRESKKEISQHRIIKACNEAGSVKKAAEILGIQTRTLYENIDKLGIGGKIKCYNPRKKRG